MLYCDELIKPAVNLGQIAMSTSTTYDFQNNLVAEKPRAQPTQFGADDVAFRSVGTQPATHVHPLAVVAMAAGYAWFLLVCWVVFAGDKEMAGAMFMVTFISVVMLGMEMALGWSARNVVPWMRTGRSWEEFLNGQVDTFTGPMTGREVFIHLAGTSGVLALGTTALGIIIALSH